MNLVKEGNFLYHLYQIEGNNNSLEMINEIFKAIKYYYRGEIFIKGETDYENIRKFLNINCEVIDYCYDNENGKDFTYLLVRLDFRLDSNYSKLKQKLMKHQYKVDDDGLEKLILDDYNRLLKDLSTVWVHKSYNSPFGSQMEVAYASKVDETFDFNDERFSHFHWEKKDKVK